ncbi:MAG TPA: hypothetical protein PKD61_28160, partial [Polyangiaceae bacterium]|nr:hypothetical protein [Polyangiaceae bacterium]
QANDGMTPEERKRHLEITRKSLDNWSKDEATREAQKKAAADEAKRKEEEEAAKKTAAASPGGGGAPKPAGNPKAAKKAAADLDSIAGDIAGQLAK